MSVTRKDIVNSVRALGIAPGDWVLVHSSMKSTGFVEGGPETVIGGFLDVLGSDGTLIFPTLSQKNWESVYRDWSLDRPSDVGLISETFRKMKGVLRSDQETHSVAAIGKDAQFVTQGHKAFGPRFGVFGDYAFSHSSPWQKMCDHNAKIVFWGVDINSNTMKHLAEYEIFEEKLKQLEACGGNEQLKNRLWHYDSRMHQGVWAFLDSYKLYEHYKSEGIVTNAVCGNAQLICITAGDCVRITEKLVHQHPDEWLNEKTLEWFSDVDKFINERKK